MPDAVQARQARVVRRVRCGTMLFVERRACSDAGQFLKGRSRMVLRRVLMTIGIESRDVLVGENLERWRCLPVGTDELTKNGSHHMLKFLGSTIGIIFLIGLIVVIGLFALVF
ncbi:hypothetical protein [Stutzerimonas kunmingensis]|uniref:Uncharacterized protein n=1 Tax=Stutzerimonas kunmingensis TaxID=1211807 RepID=A0A9X1N308_9GAMM|nr:hypothetical protein [Stutzerimonas kunmingensis]MCD1607827.1 hypothetical protein [Stutzerimonas kunmingensis]